MKSNAYSDAYKCEAWVASKLVNLGHTVRRVSLSEQQHTGNRFDILVDERIRVEVKFMRMDRASHYGKHVSFPTLPKRRKTEAGYQFQIYFDVLIGVAMFGRKRLAFIIPVDRLGGRKSLRFAWPYKPGSRRGVLTNGYKPFDPMPFYNKWNLLHNLTG
jgi:hypothetical protein